MNMRYAVVFAILSGLSLTGCLTTETEKSSPKEPALAVKSPQKKALTPKDIQLIESDDVTGTVSAAREAARELLEDAKTIYAVKEKEANKNAAEIIAKAKLEAAKSAAEEAKKERARMHEVELAKAKKEADKIIAAAKAKSEKIVAKANADGDKIRSGMTKSAKRAAADIIKKAGKDAKAILLKAEKVLVDAKKRAADVDKKSEAYLKKKMAEADVKVAKAVKEAAKSGSASHDGNAKGYVANSIVANKVLDGILEGIKSEDYDTFTHDFTESHKAQITKEKFEKESSALTKRVGICVKRSYLGRLIKGPVTIYIWKGTFSKLKNNELVIQVALEELDGKIQVFAFNIAPM